MSTLNLDLAATEAAIAEPASAPLLLDLWAPWCGPCLAMGPILERLAAETTSKLRVAKLDVEANAEANRRFKVRGIPLLILVKDGKEASRKAGVQTREQLNAWMAQEGVDLGQAGNEENLQDQLIPGGGAFYGDDELRQFFLNRWYDLADQGAIRVSRFPYWTDGHGTTSAALVKTAEAETFERLTGMPEGMGMVLDFVKATTSAQLEKIGAALPAGANVRGVPLRFVRLWLSDEQWVWPELIGPEANSLRVEWLKAADTLLRNEKVSEETWTRIADLATSLESDDPLMVVQKHFAKVIKRLSPLPSASDAIWGGLLLGVGTYLVVARGMYEAGFRGDEFSFESVRLAWYQRECPDPENRTQEETNALHARFASENADLVNRVQDRFTAYLKDLRTHVQPLELRLQELLLQALPKPSKG